MKKHTMDFVIKDGEGDEECEIGSCSVVLKVPSVKERIELMKKLGIKGKDIDDPMALMESAIGALPDFIEGIEAKVGDQVFNDLDDMGHYGFFAQILTEIQGVLFNGIPLGRN